MNQDLARLWRNYLDDVSTAAELQELESALRNPDLEAEMNAVLDAVFYDIPEQDIIDRSGTAAKENSRNYILSQPQMKAPLNRWLRISLVAAAIGAITLGLWLYTARPLLQPNAEIVNQHDIAPGRNSATITLANGKTINLSALKTGVMVQNSGLQYNDGTAVEPGHEVAPDAGQEVVVRTPNGGTYQVELADGTKVWLNAASSIRFSVQLKALVKRSVALTGEAYFEVAKDVKHPFVVRTKQQNVEVLGTHFNINSYPDEQAIKTTLLEGSVRLTCSAETAQKIILVPNQQAILTGNQIRVVPADLENVMAWKNGDFVFEGEDFKTTMRKIARWYNVEVIYDSDLNDHIELGGWVSRSSKLSEVLRRIEQASNVHFKIEGRSVFVKK